MRLFLLHTYKGTRILSHIRHFNFHVLDCSKNKTFTFWKVSLLMSWRMNHLITRIRIWKLSRSRGKHLIWISKRSLLMSTNQKTVSERIRNIQRTTKHASTSCKCFRMWFHSSNSNCFGMWFQLVCDPESLFFIFN